MLKISATAALLLSLYCFIQLVLIRFIFLLFDLYDFIFMMLLLLCYSVCETL